MKCLNIWCSKQISTIKCLNSAWVETSIQKTNMDPASVEHSSQIRQSTIKECIYIPTYHWERLLKNSKLLSTNKNCLLMNNFSSNIAFELSTKTRWWSPTHSKGIFPKDTGEHQQNTYIWHNKTKNLGKNGSPCHFSKKKSPTALNWLTPTQYHPQFEAPDTQKWQNPTVAMARAIFLASQLVNIPPHGEYTPSKKWGLPLGLNA